MWSKAKLNDGKTHEYGFGWSVGNYRSRKELGHGGGIRILLHQALWTTLP